MKFSEILHKQPPIPWTNLGEVVRRSRNYFGRDRKNFFLRYQKHEIFLDVYALAHIVTGNILG